MMVTIILIFARCGWCLCVHSFGGLAGFFIFLHDGWNGVVIFLGIVVIVFLRFVVIVFLGFVFIIFLRFVFIVLLKLDWHLFFRISS